MSVTLRYRKNADGTQTPYIDIYDKGDRKREFLVHLRLVKPQNRIDRDANNQMKFLAEQALTKRALEVQANTSGIVKASSKRGRLTDYMKDYVEKYSKKDARIVLAMYKKFCQFLNQSGKKGLVVQGLTKSVVIDFKEYLEANLNGESPANYFKKFRKVLEGLVNDGVLQSNLASGITVRRNESISKEILTFEEIKLLAETPCKNTNIKRAFLFSCYTGLRFCDITKLKYENISNGNIKVNQSKTNKLVIIPLHENLVEMLEGSEGKAGLIFKLPSHTTCLKSLNLWVKSAGINKHISWHCARHSFATALIEYGSDVNSASSLLGHSSFAYTQRYVRIVEKLKEKAISNLPA